MFERATRKVQKFRSRMRMTMIANLSWITDQLATGGDFSYEPEIAHRQFMELDEMNLDLIVDMRQEDEDSDFWAMTDVGYLNIRTDDAEGYHMPYEAFDAAVGAARPVIESGGKVFIHCHMGVNRGPSTALAVLLDQKMPATRAYDLIRQKRPQAALAYALDAMGAHLHRRGVPQSEFKRRMTALDNHIKADQTPEVVRAINKHIVRQHRLDARALGHPWIR